MVTPAKLIHLQKHFAAHYVKEKGKEYEQMVDSLCAAVDEASTSNGL